MAGLIYDDVLYSSGGQANVIESISVNNSPVTPVNKNVNIDTIPNGGTTGQVLAKASNTDGDVEWVDMSGGTTLVSIPTFTGNSFTFNGIPQGPTISNLNESACNITYKVKNTNTNISKPSAAGTYIVTASLKDPSKSFWTDITTEDITYEFTISEISVEVPTVTGSYDYSGSLQQPIISTYDNNLIQITGDLSATTVGTYTVTLSLKDKNSSHWSDNSTTDKTTTWTINKASLTVPTVTGSFTYDGNEKECTISSYNTSLISQNGYTTRTNAGTYTITFSLTDTTNTQWSDNSISDKTVDWTIAKATQSTLTVSKNSITLDADHLSDIFTISGGVGTISVSSSSTSTATATLNGSTVTVSSVNETSGVVTITVTAAETSNYLETTRTVTVNCEFLQLVAWSSATDDQISAIVNAYYNGSVTLADIQKVWHVGDIRTVNLSAMAATGVGESHRAQNVDLVILDFNHDDLTTSNNGKTKALITVQLKDCLRDASVTDTTGSSNTENGYMNSSNTNVGGWKNCARRTWCNGIFFYALPSYLQTLIKPVDKPVTVGSGSSTLENPPVSDSVFLLSEWEIFGSTTYAGAQEGTQYAYFGLATENRYKLPKWNSSLVSGVWWGRSPRGSYSTGFCSVNGYGDAGYGGASGAAGLAPAFCL